MDYIAQIKLFLFKQISSALHDLQGKLTPEGLQAIIDRAEPYILNAVNTGESLVPWVGGLLNTEQFNALEKMVFESEKAKIVAAIGFAADNTLNDVLIWLDSQVAPQTATDSSLGVPTITEGAPQ